ncbi:MAG: hypothetical protein KC609_21285 [Myxococcales bacterium]|nr:hypothetical protein [Myxococcales bacterium]
MKQLQHRHLPSVGLLRLVLCTTLLALGACGSSTTSQTTGSDTTTSGDTNAACTGNLCAGTMTPTWALEDFQPASAKFGQQYGLAEFRGRALVVALLSGW